MAYAHVQNGTITGLTSINVARWSVVQNVYTRDVSNGATAVENKDFDTGRYYYSLAGTGFFYQGGGYPKPIEVSTSNGLYGCINRANLNFARVLTNATCASTPQGQAIFIPGKTRLGGTVFGYLQDNETPLESGTIALTGFTLPLSSTHSISGDAKIRRASYENNATDGGGLGVPYQFVFTGPVTYSGTGNFLGTGTTPVSTYNAAIALDNGQYWDGAVVVQSIGVVIDYLTGLPTTARFALPFNGAVSADSTSGA